MQTASQTIPADDLEPNDAAGQAKRLQAPSGQAKFTSLTMDQAGDDDWYYFVTTEVGTANDSVFIDFDHDKGNLDLFLYSDGGGTQLDADCPPVRRGMPPPPAV